LDSTIFYDLAFGLIALGIIAIFIAVFLAACRGNGKGRVRGAGVIMIGPIPIIFGTDKKSVRSVMALALALTVMVLIVMLVYYFLLR